MIRTISLSGAAAAFGLAAAVAVTGLPAAAQSDDMSAASSGKRVLHNASVDEIVRQLSRTKKKRHLTRGLTITPAPAETASASKPESGCYAAGASAAKTRGLTVDPEPAPAGTAPGAQASDCHPGYISLIHFAYDSARLAPSSKQELDKIAMALQAPVLQRDRFVIAGHTDAAGSDAYNLSLSERRALSVVHYLEGRGVSATRLVPEGRGERELFDAEHPRAAVNRRVEIINASR